MHPGLAKDAMNLTTAVEDALAVALVREIDRHRDDAAVPAAVGDVVIFRGRARPPRAAVVEVETTDAAAATEDAAALVPVHAVAAIDPVDAGMALEADVTAHAANEIDPVTAEMVPVVDNETGQKTAEMAREVVIGTVHPTVARTVKDATNQMEKGKTVAVDGVMSRPRRRKRATKSTFPLATQVPNCLL